MAKQHIEVLQRRLADRDAEVASVKKKMDAMREQFMQRHNAEREEIERLNKALFDKNAKSIADIRNDINKTARHISGVTALPKLHLLLSLCSGS